MATGHPTTSVRRFWLLLPALNYTDIPYGGTADQLLALRQGEVDFSVAKVADFASFTSEVKVLAVYNQERLEGYPDVLPWANWVTIDRSAGFLPLHRGALPAPRECDQVL